jgi:hypothetical protein
MIATNHYFVIINVFITTTLTITTVTATTATLWSWSIDLLGCFEMMIFLFLSLFMRGRGQCWGSDPGPDACQASTLLLSYFASPYMTFLNLPKIILY